MVEENENSSANGEDKAIENLESESKSAKKKKKKKKAKAGSL